MSETPNLNMPYILEAQAQKHVTHNEAIRSLDALVQLVVEDRTLDAPPATPQEGARYIIASVASGVWTGKETQIAAWQDGAWAFFIPNTGWQAWINNEALQLYFDGASWQQHPKGPSLIANTSPMLAQTRFEILEEEVSLTGPFTDSAIIIPDRAIVLAVTTRTTQAITGASSYDCGIVGALSKYGAALGIALDSTNSGVTGPTAFYADTPVRLSANTADFIGGKVRMAIHYMMCSAPTS